MTPQGDLVALATTVVASVFALAFVFGAITQRTNFCTMGSVADVVSFGDWTRMRQWLLAIAVAILGTNLLAAAGVIGFRDTEDTANHLVSAALMGFGGVTALGCTIGQGLSGVSTLAIGSFIALTAIVTGAVLALKYQAWRLDRIAA